jgi:peptide/nickel transport system substrate-binding protein
MSNEPRAGWLEDLTRREVLRRGLAGGAALSASSLLAACGSSGGGGGASSTADGGATQAKLRAGGILRVGATGGGAKDTIDAHIPTTDPRSTTASRSPPTT